jgi:hypothetical protein
MILDFCSLFNFNFQALVCKGNMYAFFFPVFFLNTSELPRNRERLNLQDVRIIGKRISNNSLHKKP